MEEHVCVGAPFRVPGATAGAASTVPLRFSRLGHQKMLTGLWSNPRQWAVLPIAALTEKACLSTPPPLPPLLSTTATPQSTRCIVKKWEGTLEPSCSMKVGCSVCLLMRWKEDGSEKWNKVKEHIQKTERSFVGGERGSCRHFFPPASFEVQVRH